jgi:flagellar hook-associated protein 2
MGMSVDGLITGMNTTDTVAQLMTVEAAPQTALKAKVSVQNSMVASYQSVNSRLSSLLTAARALGSPDTWGSVKATSNSDAAVVTAMAGAAVGSLTFRVDTLAAAHTVTFSEAGKSVSSISDASTSSILSGNNIDITLADGSTKTLTPADGSLQSVVAAINGTADSAYRAAAVQIGPGKYTLQLTARTTGSATAFDPPAGIDPSVLGAGKATTLGADAQLTIGSTGDAYQVTSATNTFANVLQGVTITATREQTATDPRVTVNMASDPDGIAAKVQALVDNANVALTEIASQTAISTGDTAAGALVGDSAMRQLTQDILSTVSGGAGTLGSYSSVGVGLDRSGKLTFDKDAFTDAYEADPAKTQAYFDSYTEVANPLTSTTKFDPGWDAPQGLARRLETLTAQASEGVILPTDPITKPKQGTLQGLIQRQTESISDLNDQVSAWDVRLDLRKTALSLQFSNLEVALGKMKSQSSWLSSQLASLS